jgi:hypothetical protein
MSLTPKPQLFGLLAGLFLAVGLVLSAMLVTSAWLKVAESRTVSVTGSARRAVTSDLIVWRGAFSVEAPSVIDAQKVLKDHRRLVEAFLVSQAVTNAVFSSIGIQELKSRADQTTTQQKTTGYRLEQKVEIRSEDVARTMQLDQLSTALLEQGVAFIPFQPEFIYTKAGDLKIELLSDATKDARVRAERIAREGGRRIGDLRSAKMGVFQITPLHSRETAWDGMNDTTTLEKSVTSVVTAQFSIQ